MQRLLAALGACAVVGAVLAGPPDPPSPFDRLVGQLGSPRFADREAATRGLEKAGLAAAPHLEAALRHPDAEVRRRAGEVLGRIGRTADTGRRLAAPTVALDYQSVPLAVALNDLAARTKIPLVLDQERVADLRRPVSVTTAELPVWEAVEAFCKAAGLRESFAAELTPPKPTLQKRVNYPVPPPPLPMPGEVPVTLVDGPPDGLPASRGTAVRVVALPASFPKNRVHLGTGEVVIHLDVAPVAVLNWQETLGVRVVRAVDDRGRPAAGVVAGPRPDEPDFTPLDLLANNLESLPPPPAAYRNPRVVPVSVKLAGPGVRSLRVLEGAVTGEVVVPQQPLITAADPAAKVGRPLDGPNGLRLTIQDVQRPAANGPVTFRVELRSPSAWLINRRANPFGGPMWPDTNRPGAVPPRIQGYDAAGNPVAGTASGTGDISDDFTTVTQHLTLTYRPDRVPAKLVVVGPRTLTVEVPFRLANVPLP